VALLLSLAVTTPAALLAETRPARALVPYVYVPEAKELEGAGLGIAQAATRLLRLGQVDDAARLAELTVRLLPEDPRGWVLLAEAQLRANNIDKALLALGRAKQLDPNNPGIWFAEGSLALRKGRPAEAIPLLRKGLQLDAQNSGAYFDLGNAQLLLNEPSKALASFERASRLRNDFWEAINNQGLVLYEAGRVTEALDRWRRVLKLKPDVAETSLALAAALHGLGAKHRAEALQLAESALGEDPNYALESYQKEQLWGPRLRTATRQLLALPELKPVVERALLNATATDEGGGEDSEE
jgi:tetratricopeptide (TPR) repeat protein